VLGQRARGNFAKALRFLRLRSKLYAKPLCKDKTATALQVRSVLWLCANTPVCFKDIEAIMMSAIPRSRLSFDGQLQSANRFWKPMTGLPAGALRFSDRFFVIAASRRGTTGAPFCTSRLHYACASRYRHSGASCCAFLQHMRHRFRQRRRGSAFKGRLGIPKRPKAVSEAQSRLP